MTTDQKRIILATVPILKEHGVLLTTHFYKRMFIHNPELKNLFNMGNQQQGKQQNALAFAVLAYAENISDPSVLLPVVDRIGHKHTSLNIQPEQYMVVGKHLLASISEVLADAATPEILDAWSAAYAQLAALMSGHEATLYEKQTMAVNGWTGWRLFEIGKRVKESDEICSFYLYPADKGKVSPHLPGQFISLKLFLPDLNLDQIRQYSISNSPGDEYYRISVKRERGSDLDSNGLISNRLHDFMQVGSTVELTSPSGNFVIPEKLDSPVMFISGGVGLTPFMSMIQYLADQGKKSPVTWLHGCRNSSVHAFKDDLTKLTEKYDHIQQHVFYNTPSEQELSNGIYGGHLNLNTVKAISHTADTLYYVCGPSAFITKQVNDLKNSGVNTERIFFEEFGPQVLQLN